MSNNYESPKSRSILEIFKWLIVVILLVIVIFGNYFYQEYSLPLRIIAILCIITTASIVALITNKGKSLIIFAREARIELRKIIWPTRQETWQTTLIIIAITIITSLILWGLDAIFVYLISFITSLRF